MRLLLLLAPSLALTLALSQLPAQKLRRAVGAADLVVVATYVRVQPTNNVLIHQMKVVEILRGSEAIRRDGKILERFSIVEFKRLSTHNRPSPATTRLYCLHDFGAKAKKAQLPQGFGPYFKMSGHPGSNPEIRGPLEKDSCLAFARILTDSQKGQAPRKVALRLFEVALRGDPRVRTEAAEVLAERPILSAYLTRLHMSDLLARAVGETEDITYKIALASLCAEKRMPSLIPALCVSVEQVGDKSFLRALGRLAAYLHREKAVDVLRPYVARARGKTRDRMIYALGATSTESALNTLLELQASKKDKKAVEAALAIHGSPRAKAAIAHKKDR